jgi:hypothetical protein
MRNFAMRCEDARSQLFDYLDQTLAGRERADLAEHLDTCRSCQSDHETLSDLALQAEVWHELPAPRWQPPRVGNGFEFSSLQQWFPSLASALALILVAGLYLQSAETALPAAGNGGQTAAKTPPAGQMTPVNASADARLISNRLERQQELQALVQLLRTEMDRRNEETEESLRYVIAHQLQGQQEIDDLYQYIRKVSLNGPRLQEQM